MRTLPPPPDFRYLRLSAGPRVPLGPWALVALSALGLTAGALEGHSPGAVALGTLGGGALGFALRRVSGPSAARGGATRATMAVVPWGVLVEPDDGARVLHWAAIGEVDVEVLYGRDQETPLARWSLVTVRAGNERFCGRAPGAVALEGLLAHLPRYAEEQAHRVALDLDGAQAAAGPIEPSCAPLFASATAFLAGGASSRLGLEASGYRRGAALSATSEAERVLRQVLRDRSAREVDPRPFAATLAALLQVRALGDDLVSLVQSPHPVVAGVARAAAARLGVPRMRVGAVDEVAPFLLDQDLASLRAFAAGGAFG